MPAPAAISSASAFASASAARATRSGSGGGGGMRPEGRSLPLAERGRVVVVAGDHLERPARGPAGAAGLVVRGDVGRTAGEGPGDAGPQPDAQVEPGRRRLPVEDEGAPLDLVA